MEGKNGVADLWPVGSSLKIGCQSQLSFYLCCLSCGGCSMLGQGVRKGPRYGGNNLISFFGGAAAPITFNWASPLNSMVFMAMREDKILNASRPQFQLWSFSD